MRSPFGRRRRAPDLAPAPLVDVESELLGACMAADEAMAALSVALAARRLAMVRLTARTGLLGKGMITRLFSPSTVSAALAAHEAIQHFHLAYVLVDHRRTLTDSARAAIDATACHRIQPTAPADPGLAEEIPAHAVAHG